MEKSYRKFAPKASPRLLSNFSKQSKTLHARNFLEVRYFERGLSKSLKISNFIFFLTQSLPIDKIIKSRRDLELKTSRCSGYETSSEKLYYYSCINWPSLMMKYNPVILKVTSANLSKPIHDIINFPIFNFTFESRKSGKEEKNYKNLNISRTKRVF